MKNLRWDLLNLKVHQEPYEPVVDMEEAETMFSGTRQMKDLEEKVKQLEQQIAALGEMGKTAAVD